MYGEDGNSKERAVKVAKDRECDRRKGKSGTREEAKNVKKERNHKRLVTYFTFFQQEKCQQTKFLKEKP